MLVQEDRVERYANRDLVKWCPKRPVGMIICKSSRGLSYRESEPVLINVAPLNLSPVSNADLNELMTVKDIQVNYY